MAIPAELKASIRTGMGKGSARKLRAVGLVPAVVYGHGDATRLLTVDAHKIERLFNRIAVENTVIQLEIEGEGTVPVLVREVQSHAYRADVLHIDFYQVHAGELLTVTVPVHLIGTPEGVRTGGGMLDQILHDVEIRCTPDRIPEAIEIDVHALEINTSLHVRDLSVGADIEILADADQTVCAVIPPTVSALEASAETTDGVGGGVK